LEAKARVILVDYPDAESSTIYAGHAIAPYNAASWAELSIMNRAFGGGFESRLNMNLREDKSWSYGYRSGVNRNTSGDMTLASSGQVQTDKTMESMVEIRREFEDYISTRPATSGEIERIKLNRTRSLPGAFSTNLGFLSSIIGSDSYGLPFNYAETSAKRIETVTVEGVNERARTSMIPSKLTWIVVGDLEKIEENVRSLGYGEVEVWDAYGNKVR
jgi:zinc protease